jgi:hypothetical protein
VAVEKKEVAGRCMASLHDNFLGYEALSYVVSGKNTRLFEILRSLGINRDLCSSPRYSPRYSGVRKQGCRYGYNVRLTCGVNKQVS